MLIQLRLRENRSLLTGTSLPMLLVFLSTIRQRTYQFAKNGR
jgi:hypothetical protein